MVVIKNQLNIINVKQPLTFLLLLLLAILMASCTHVKRDGPPSFYVDETRIPNAVPKPEPLSKRNLAVYRVKGKTYTTLKSSKNFQEVGIASWYGTLFHERSTSSGEPYDMLGMTAAHKTLPLPTYVEVLNLKNKRKVIVKVNDRGPFKDNRIIDLSYVAAKKLGMIGHGTAYVKVTAIDPYQYQHRMMLAQNKPSSTKTLGKPLHHSTYARIKKSRYVEVGSYKNHAHAMRIKEQLTHQLNLPVFVTKNKSSHYLVHVGPVKNEKMVVLIKKRLHKMRNIT